MDHTRSYSATNRILSHVDILHVIVDEVESRAVLAALASTCHSFSTLALDKLWAHLDSPYALAKTMDPELWDEYECDAESVYDHQTQRMIVCINFLFLLTLSLLTN
jgi:hypothetical protein